MNRILDRSIVFGLMAITALMIAPAGIHAQSSRPTSKSGASKPEGVRHNLFLRGFLAEVLDQDRDLAIATYRKAASLPEAPKSERVLAMVRWAELAWLNGDQEDLRAAGRQLASMQVAAPVPPAGAGPTQPREIPRMLSQPASTKRNQQLETARRNLLADLSRPRRFSRLTRQRHVLLQYRSRLPDLFEQRSTRLLSIKDPVIQRLQRELLAAQERGALNAIGRLAQQVRRRWNELQRERPQRQEGKRRAVITRRHLDGQHEQALRWERALLPSTNARGQTRQLLQRIQGMSEGITRANFRTVRRRVVSLSKRRGISGQERDVLQALVQRLDELAQATQLRQALQLAARVPYRRELWR